MHIRLAREQDLEAVRAIENWAIEHTASNFNVEALSPEAVHASWAAEHDRYPWFVATDGERILGFARAAPHRGRCAYAFAVEVAVYVQPDSHGQGVGRALYETLLPTLRLQGYQCALAGIAQPNEPSVRLHEGMGFESVGTFRRVGWKFGLWHDVGYWELILQPALDAPEPLRRVEDVVER